MEAPSVAIARGKGDAGYSGCYGQIETAIGEGRDGERITGDQSQVRIAATE